MSQGRDRTVSFLTHEWQTTAEVTAKASPAGVSYPHTTVAQHLRSAFRDGLIESRVRKAVGPGGLVREWRLRQ